MLLYWSCLEEAGVGRKLSQPEAYVGKTESRDLGFEKCLHCNTAQTGFIYGKFNVNQQLALF